MPYPHQVADQIAADMIASGQVRMQMWELLCDALPMEILAERPVQIFPVVCASRVEPIRKAHYLEYAGTPASYATLIQFFTIRFLPGTQCCAETC